MATCCHSTRREVRRRHRRRPDRRDGDRGRLRRPPMPRDRGAARRGGAVGRRVHGRRPRVAPPFAEHAGSCGLGAAPLHKIDSTLRGSWAHEIVGPAGAAVRWWWPAFRPRASVWTVWSTSTVSRRRGRGDRRSKSRALESTRRLPLRRGASAVDAVTPSSWPSGSRRGVRCASASGDRRTST
jgi:hypothetical protein